MTRQCVCGIKYCDRIEKTVHNEIISYFSDALCQYLKHTNLRNFIQEDFIHAAIYPYATEFTSNKILHIPFEHRVWPKHHKLQAQLQRIQNWLNYCWPFIIAIRTLLTPFNNEIRSNQRVIPEWSATESDGYNANDQIEDTQNDDASFQTEATAILNTNISHFRSITGKLYLTHLKSKRKTIKNFRFFLKWWLLQKM